MMRPSLAILASAILIGGCASSSGRASAPASPARARLTGDEVTALATLIRLEDRREWDAGVVQALAASPSSLVRSRAALAAGRIGDKRAIQLPVRMLADPDTAVAADAAFALGLLADSAAVPMLAALLEPRNAAGRPTVAGAAATALARIPTAASRAAVEAFLRAAPVDRAPIEAAGPALLAVWRYPRPGDPTPILPWLASADPEIRWRAAYALTRRPDPRAAPALGQLVGDADERVRSFAVRGLAYPLADSSSVGTDAALDLLLHAVRDPALAVRVNATRTLGGYADLRSIDALRSILLGPDPHPAITAAEALGRLGPKALGSTADLRAVALDAARPVGLRTAALAALVTVEPGDAHTVAGTLAGDAGWRLRAAAGAAFASLGPQARPRMEALAHDRDPRVAAATLGAAIEAAGKDVAPLRGMLVEAITAADVQVRATAAGGLGTLADSTTVPLLLDAYARAQRDTLNDAALAAIDALGAMKDARTAAARAFFARFPRSADELARHHAAAAFGDTLAAPWLPIHPVETSRSPGDYRWLVRDYVAPSLAGRSPRVRFTTTRGTFDVELAAADAPLTVQSFLTLARAGYFDGQEWPRVVANFVVQGGDPRGDTSGSPGYAIRDEINRLPYLRGTVGMALSGPDTGGSQFFVTHSPQPHLDGGYTVFGRVVQGMDVVDRILQGDRILHVQELR